MTRGLGNMENIDGCHFLRVPNAFHDDCSDVEMIIVADPQITPV